MSTLAPLAAAVAGNLIVTPAQAACGGLGQNACTILQRPGKPCDAGLVEKPFGRCSRPQPVALNCGGAGQNACTVLQRPGKPCNDGLNLTAAIGGRCVAPSPAQQLVNILPAVTRGHQQAMAGIRACMSSRGRKERFKQAIQAKNSVSANRLLNECKSSQAAATLRRAPQNAPGAEVNRENYFNTLAIGLSGGIQIIGGAGVEAGVVADLNGQKPLRFYTVSETAVGLGVNVGVDVNVSVSRDAMPSQKKVTKDTAYVVAGKFLGGGGLSYNFNNHHRNLPSTPVNDFDGFGVAGGVGVGVNLMSKHQQITTIW